MNWSARRIFFYMRNDDVVSARVRSSSTAYIKKWDMFMFLFFLEICI